MSPRDSSAATIGETSASLQEHAHLSCRHSCCIAVPASSLCPSSRSMTTPQNVTQHLCTSSASHSLLPAHALSRLVRTAPPTHAATSWSCRRLHLHHCGPVVSHLLSKPLTLYLSPPSALPGMREHPPIPVVDLADHIERLKANDGLRFSQEYEVRDSQYVHIALSHYLTACKGRSSIGSAKENFSGENERASATQASC